MTAIPVQFPDESVKLDDVEEGRVLTALEVMYEGGSLHGKTGTFALQHNATMNRGAGAVNIVVVPDSGTGELTGLSGNLSIEITGGKHGYVFEYALD